MSHPLSGSEREAERRGMQMPTVRRLFDPSGVTNSGSVHHNYFETEVLSVREQAASLSSRAVLESMNSPDASGYALDFQSGAQDYVNHHYIGEGQPSSYDLEGYPDSPPIGSLEPVTSHGSDRSQRSARRSMLRHYSSVMSDYPLETTPLIEEEAEGGESDIVYSSGIGNSGTALGSHITAVKILSYIPSVIVGVLLNILDGLSYGMILFPIGSTVFVGLESVGLALFYVSTIVSQLVYSAGASKFPACVGSEMIEIVPFFHAIASSIAVSLQDSPREEILATTIASFAVSSVITGMVFFLLGYLRLGTLVGFFPRHILVGCIGGVGFFLVVTGIEVSTRLTSSFSFNLDMLRFLSSTSVIPHWGSCLALAAVLMWTERRFPSPLLIPAILIVTFCLFHLIVYALPGIDLEAARLGGWVFPAQEAGEPWYYFYELYKPSLIHVKPILQTFPVMLALTFFGIIHVPINIPALAAATKNDEVNVNAELVAHGISNTLSGLFGSIQNYLVYTNSVMFIKSGADSHIAGIMLAIATAFVMFAGPVIIGYIPVIVVGSLIFVMGLDLMAEALVDTWGIVGNNEYATIVAIVATMGGYDFVVGIVVGIILACLFFVIASARTNPIKATFSGERAHSTVRRHPLLQNFLSKVGRQVVIIKLQGALFFGTNVQIERAIQRDILDQAHGIKYLVVDIKAVTDIDYCTADIFTRLKRRLDSKGIRLILSGAPDNEEKISGLRAVDLVQGHDHSSGHFSVKVFPSLNTALEWCENQFVEGYYRHRASIVDRRGGPPSMFQPVPKRTSHSSNSTGFSYPSGGMYHPAGTTPRASYLRQAAENSAAEEFKTVNKYHRFKQPLGLLLQIAEGVSTQDEDFWFKITHYFERKEYGPGIALEGRKFILVESGIVHVQYDAAFFETILAGTAYGELSFFSHTEMESKVQLTTEASSVLWVMSPERYKDLCSSAEGNEMARELLQVAFHIASDRFTALTQYVTTAL